MLKSLSKLFGLAPNAFGLDQLEGVASTMEARGQTIDPQTLMTVVTVGEVAGWFSFTAPAEAQAEVERKIAEVFDLRNSIDAARSETAEKLDALHERIKLTERSLQMREASVDRQITSAKARTDVVRGLQALIGTAPTKSSDPTVA